MTIKIKKNHFNWWFFFFLLYIYQNDYYFNMEQTETKNEFWYNDFETCKKVLYSIKQVLIEKNKRYGNAALEPIGVFYKGDAANSICIRIDDKLSRIKNSSTLRKNDLYDLLGYCLLYLVANYWNETDTFEEKIQNFCDSMLTHYTNNIIRMNKYINNESYTYNGFSKENYRDEVIDSLNGICSEIKNSEQVHLHLVHRLFNVLVVYFIQNKITDFTDLID